MSDSLKNVIEIEKALSIPPGFFLKLLKEDDWSFVIKLHVLIEASITHLLVIASDNRGLEEVYGRLDLSNVKTGKLAFVRKLDLLDKNYITFVRTISEVRNQFAHNISNVGLDLKGYLSSCDKSKQDSFCTNVSVGMPDCIEIAGISMPTKEYILDNPKLHIWMISMYLIERIYFAKQRIEIDRSYTEFARECTEVSAKQTKMSEQALGILDDLKSDFNPEK